MKECPISELFYMTDFITIYSVLTYIHKTVTTALNAEY
jgi:hypothetical protein